MKLHVVMLLIVALPGICLADEGRIPIYEPVVLAGAGASGKYTVVRNISHTNTVITINGTGVEEVEIDLNGFTLERTTQGHPVRASNVKSLIVRDGYIRASPDGGAVIAVDNSTEFGEVIIQSVKLFGGSVGIDLEDVPNFRIVDNVVASTGQGIRSVGAEGARSGGIIARNVVKETIGFGIIIGDNTSTPHGLHILNNRVENTGNDAIVVKRANSFIIEGNVISNIDTSGIKVQASTSGRVLGNTVHQAATGIFLLSDTQNCLVVDNVVGNNTGVGLLANGTGHHIERNLMSNNAGGGLVLDGDKVFFGRNTAVDNAGTPTCGTSPPAGCATPDFCDNGTGNKSFGDNFMPDGC